MKTVASAPGKVLLTGAYLVLERPNAGLVLSTSARFYAIVQPIHPDYDHPAGEAATAAPLVLEVKVVSPQLQRELCYSLDADELTMLPVPPGSGQGNPFVEKAVLLTVAAAKQAAEDDEEERASLLRKLAQGLEITILGDNDFYSQRKVLAARELPLASKSLEALPAFAPASVGAPEESGAGGGGQVSAPEIAKTGLGSSAAMVTAVVAALLQHLGVVTLPTAAGKADGGMGKEAGEEARRLVHTLAQAAHCAGQGKVGSGFDVSAAVYGSQRYVRFSPSVLADLSAHPSKLAESVLTRTWDEDRRTGYSLPSGMLLMVGEPGAGGSSTPSMVGAVQRWRKAEPEDARRMWDALASTNKDVEDSLSQLRQLAAQEPATWQEAIRTCGACQATQWAEVSASTGGASAVESALLNARSAFGRVRALLREMGEKAGVPIEPPEQTDILDASVSVEGVLLAGVPGAGGYDAVFAIVLGEDARRRLDELWASKGVLALLAQENSWGVSSEEGDPREQQ